MGKGPTDSRPASLLKERLAAVRVALESDGRHHYRMTFDLLDQMAELAPDEVPIRILDVGAGTGTWVEESLWELPEFVIVDRVDIIDPSVTTPVTGACWRSSVEEMPLVPSESYRYVLANWLLEHVQRLDDALGELFRVLEPGGRLLATVPNTLAPEFVVARITPDWFHRVFQPNATPTNYSYRSLHDLVGRLESKGFQTIGVDPSPEAEDALARASPLLGRVGAAYDRFLLRHHLVRMMGHAFILAERPMRVEG